MLLCCLHTEVLHFVMLFAYIVCICCLHMLFAYVVCICCLHMLFAYIVCICCLQMLLTYIIYIQVYCYVVYILVCCTLLAYAVNTCLQMLLTCWHMVCYQVVYLSVYHKSSPFPYKFAFKGAFSIRKLSSPHRIAPCLCSKKVYLLGSLIPFLHCAKINQKQLLHFNWIYLTNFNPLMLRNSSRNLRYIRHLGKHIALPEVLFNTET